MEARRSRRLRKRKSFDEMTMDELYEECGMTKKIKCKKCGKPESEWDLLEGYCLLCAGRLIQAAKKYVFLRDQSGYDAQCERKDSWDQLKGAVG